jgi:hypothetical protein
MLDLGSGACEEQLEKLPDQFRLGDPEKINVSFFHKDASDILCRMEMLRSENDNN